jgi:hypothetical protein
MNGVQVGATTAIGLLMAGLAACEAGARRGGFAGNFSVRWIDDSIWGHCDMLIQVLAKGPDTVTTSCRSEDGPLLRRNRSLVPAEVEHLRGLLRHATPFEGQSWGRDRRGLDHSLVTLKIDDGDRVAVLVVSENDTFDRPPRKSLLDALEAILRSTDARRDTP